MQTTALSEALRELFDMDVEDAHEVSNVVLDAFAGTEEVQDDELDQDLRSIFYTLEAKKLLTFRREEYTEGTGERRRAFFWRLRKDQIRQHTSHARSRADVMHDVYQSLPAAVWARRAS